METLVLATYDIQRKKRQFTSSITMSIDPFLSN